MTTSEKRRYPRIDSLNLSYVCIDEKGNTVHEGMGRTLNVSLSGILLETHFDIQEGRTLSLTIAMEDDLLDLSGAVIRSRKTGENRYLTGIDFEEVDLESHVVLRKFIQYFREAQKEET